MTLLEVMQSGKKFTHHNWDKNYWMEWTGTHFNDSIGGQPESINNRAGGYSLYVGPLVWETDEITVESNLRRGRNKRGTIKVPKIFIGKIVKIRIEVIANED